MSTGIQCTICFDEHDFDQLFFPDSCGHMFCNGCMEDNIRASLKEGKVSIKCPSIDCPFDLGYYEIKHILQNDKESIEKYEKFLYQQSIEKLDDVVWCPVAHCGAAVPIQIGGKRAKCINCNFIFCLKCRDEQHDNTCEWNQKWKGKLDTFEAYREAYGDKLKVCPGCGNLCEKVSGCSTVPCAKCHVTFCWLCCVKLDNTSNHFDVPNGCKNTYNKGDTPVRQVEVEDE